MDASCATGTSLAGLLFFLDSIKRKKLTVYAFMRQTCKELKQALRSQAAHFALTCEPVVDANSMYA
jgi:hypothetical protein